MLGDIESTMGKNFDLTRTYFFTNIKFTSFTLWLWLFTFKWK